MMTAAIARRADELTAQGATFVTATVVRVQHPTSVVPGNVALITPDGTIEGFVGGVCAEHSVRAYSLITMTTGEPVLLRILPDAEPLDPDEVDDVLAQGRELESEDGTVTVQNPCLSGGAIEVFLEPVVPAPRVLVVGDTPIADAVRRIGAELGLDMVAVDADSSDPATGDLALVVAAHGRDELHMLRRGLEAGVAYVGLVASTTRGAGVLDELRADGVPAELLTRIDVPAGIAIGARLPGEIALAILARVVAVRRDETLAAPRPALKAVPATPPAGVAIDPICGMTVAAVPGTLHVTDGDETVYFCREGCRTTYLETHQDAVVR